MNTGLQCWEGVKHFNNKAFGLFKIFVCSIKNFISKQFTKAIAFTLAETLIVMGINGVVAALTLPNLNSSTGDREKVAKVKKIYQYLNDALGRAEAVYGPYDTWFQNDTNAAAKSKRMGERMTEFMKVSKNCAMEQNKGCFTNSKLKDLGGDDIYNLDASNSYYKIITADGASVSFYNGVTIDVDIDGPNKGPYTLGKDIFSFTIAENLGVMPFGYNSSFSDLLSSLSSSSLGTPAAAWVINYDNMDYLKLNSSKKCPNGTTPTESNPRCK